METIKNDAVKLPDMIMCGDHPSFTKTELSVKDSKTDGKSKEREKPVASRTRISPTSSRTEAEHRGRATSEHALRLLEARRRVRSLEVVHRPDVDITAPGNRTLVQAALGSFRWPPYLLCVWVLVLLLTHALHGAAALLERALPALRKFCQYFRTWTENSWKTETELNQRIYPIALACLTCLLYTLYFGLYALYSITVWSVEPLCAEMEDKRSSTLIHEPKVTNYVEEVNSKANTSVKQ